MAEWQSLTAAIILGRELWGKAPGPSRPRRHLPGIPGPALLDPVGAPATGKLFICYRRSDSADITGRFYDRLVARFGRDTVFKDVDSIPLGADFRVHIDSTIRQCSALIVVIGREWLSAKNAAGGRRIDDELDHVQIEIHSAMKRDVRVIPVLVHDAQHPAPNELPESIRELSFRNGASIRSDPHFNSDVNLIIAHIERLLAPALEPQVAPAPPVLPVTRVQVQPVVKPAARPLAQPEPRVVEAKVQSREADSRAGAPRRNISIRVFVLLVLAVLGILTAGGVAIRTWTAFERISQVSRDKAVLNNLRQLSAAADQFYLENGVSTVRLDQLVGPDKYVKSLTPVEGEDYGQIRFSQGSSLVVRTRDGREITYSP